MKTSTQRLTLLVNFINVAIGLVIISLIYWLAYNLPYVGKFSKFQEGLPSDSQFDGIKRGMSLIVYFVIFLIVIVHAFFGMLLLAVRKFLRSILHNGVFHITHANKIRKIAIFFLCLAGLALFFNVIYMLAAVNKGNMLAFKTAILNLRGIFENYLLIALIAFSIAEIFIAGMKLKQENDLTI